MITKRFYSMLLSLLVIFWCGGEPVSQTHRAFAFQSETAYFKIAFPPTQDIFVIALSNPQQIQEARDIVQGLERNKIHVMGTITATPVYYNHAWSYHLEPASIQFFENVVEVCDAHPQYVEEHLAEIGGSFLPGRQWCPWSSQVIEEVKMTNVFLPLIYRR